MSHSKRLGFSLIEMSVVLLIIGLLIGGVMAGQNLLRGSQVKSIVSKKDVYVQAVANFRTKYKMLPGDFNKATQIWGAQHATPATCVTTASSSRLTCDGNGDGRLFFDLATKHETTRFWQHLSNEGLIEGTYNGIISGAVNGQVPGTNVPRGPLEDTGFSVRWIGTIGSGMTMAGPPAGADANYYDGVYKNVMLYGGRLADDFTVKPKLTAEEAADIDIKYDNGKPDSGNILSFYAVYSTYSPDCNAYNTSFEYNKTNTNPNICTMVFKTGF